MGVEVGSPWPLVGRDRELDVLVAWLRDGDGCGGVIVGPAGVGKSRLVTEAVSAAAADTDAPMATVHVVATAASRDIPLGAFVGTVDPVPAHGTSLGETLARAAADLGGRAPEGGRLVVVVDDVHRLDEASVALLHVLVRQEQVAVLATLRDGPMTPETVTELWKDGRLERLDLGPLGETDTARLIDRVLGDRADSGTHRVLWERTRGNVLYLRELLLAAVQHGTLHKERGLWRLVRTDVGSARLTDLVEARFAGLDRAERELAELVALSEPVDVDVLRHLSGADVIEAVEAQGLLEVTAADERVEVCLAHPVYGEVLRDRMPVLRAMALRSELADLVEGSAGWREDDALRVAVWRLDSHDPVDARLLLTAARRALFGRNPALAERLAAKAHEVEPGLDIAIVWAEALGTLGRHDEVARLLETTANEVSEAADVAMVTMERANALFWGLHQPAAAEAVLMEGVNRLAGTDWATEVACHLAGQRVFGGQQRDALDVLEPYLHDERDRIFLAAVAPGGPALVLVGRGQEALDLATRAFATRLELGDQRVLADAGVHIVTRALALTEAGEVDDADAAAELGFQLALDFHTDEGRAWFALCRGRAALLRGRVASAARLFAEGAVAFVGAERPEGRRWCVAGQAWATAMLGLDAAPLIGELDAMDDTVALMMEPEVHRARAWAAAAAGDLGQAASHLADGIDRAARTGAATLELAARHDVLRLGTGPVDVDAIADLAERVDGRLARLRLRHAVAVAAHDGPALLVLADELEQAGLWLLAAEVSAAAAHACAAAGLRRGAAEAASRQVRNRDRCEGASTPGLSSASPVAALTPREREIAVLAARGGTSREIADRLGVSRRTVENHLQRAYDKLGVAGRVDLGHALDLDPIVPAAPAAHRS